MALLRPTLKDVANLSGVSEISVSRVMRNAPNISAKMREKVEAAALELNYTPNKVAGALASNTTDLIGVIVPTLKCVEHTKILSSVESALGKSQYRMMLGVSDFSSQQEIKIVKDFLAWNPSGVIMIGAGFSDATKQLLSQSEAIFIEVLNEATHSEEDNFGVSFDNAVKDLVANWKQQRFKNIVYAGAGEGKLFSRRFKSTLQKELNATRDLSLVSVQVNDALTKNAGVGIYSKILQQQPKTDAVFFDQADHAVVASVFRSVKQSNHIGFASFNNSIHMPSRESSIDLIDVPYEDIGLGAVNFFIHKTSPECLPREQKSRLSATFIKSQRY